MVHGTEIYRNESFLPDEYRSIYESNLDNQYFVNTGGFHIMIMTMMDDGDWDNRNFIKVNT